MKHPDATKLEQALTHLACATTRHAAIIMSERDQLGRDRYGQDVDENPLKAAQWADHAIEEAADGLKYAIRAREEARKLETEVEALRTENAALVEALEALVGDNAATSLCVHKQMDAFGRVAGTWSHEAQTKARATLAKHKTQP